MITENSLKESGYFVEEIVGVRSIGVSGEKLVRDEKGNKYFIRIYTWAGFPVDSVEVEFRDELDRIFDFTFCKPSTIKEAEEIIENVWQKMEYSYLD